MRVRGRMVWKISSSQMVLLMLASLLMTWYSSSQLCETSKRRDAIRPSKTHLLILTSWRSGSSFVGQLFNQNPKVFYLIEPTWHVWASMPNESYRLLHMPVRDLLRSVFYCDMSTFQPYMRRGRFITDLFLWQDSRALCSQPACQAFKRSDIVDRQTCFRKCGKISLQGMEETCQTYSHIVVKAVRFLDLDVLYPLLKDPLLNLKIVHLVRDPRAVLFSREHFQGLDRDDHTITGTKNKTADVFQVMREICAAQVRIYNSSLHDLQPFLKDRYVMVRFEDLVKDPVKHIKDLYRYVDLNLTPKLEAWVYNITHGEIPKDHRLLPLTGDSEKIAQKWRNELNFQKVRRLQEICKDEMEIFGYRMVKSEQDQKNMSVDVVLSRIINPDWD